MQTVQTVQPLRRWVPGPAPAKPLQGGRSAGLRLDGVSGKDIAFCAEFAVHGGVAVSRQGFKAETELLRLQHAGLLEVERDPAPPFAMTRVALSPAARELLFGPAARSQPGEAAMKAKAEPGTSPFVASATAAAQERSLRRNGFEVARGMIGAAVKAELAGWKAGADGGDAAELEARIMARLNQIEAPFGA